MSVNLPSTPSADMNVGELLAKMEEKHYKLEEKERPNKKQQLDDYIEQALTQAFGKIAGTGPGAFKTLMNLWVTMKDSLPKHGELYKFAHAQVDLFKHNEALIKDELALTHAKSDLNHDLNVINDANNYIHSHDHWYDYLNPTVDSELAYFAGLKLIYEHKAVNAANAVVTTGEAVLVEKASIVGESEDFNEMKAQEASGSIDKANQDAAQMKEQLSLMDGLFKAMPTNNKA